MISRLALRPPDLQERARFSTEPFGGATSAHARDRFSSLIPSADLVRGGNWCNMQCNLQCRSVWRSNTPRRGPQVQSYRAGGACSGLPRNNPTALICCYAHIAQLMPGATAKKSHSTLDHRGAVAQAVRGLLRGDRLAVFDQLRVIAVILAEVRCCCALTAQQLELPRS